jgi:hypothetical protein
MSAVTNLAEYRAYRQSPLTAYIRFTEALQLALETMLHYQFAAHRDFLRQFIR